LQRPPQRGACALPSSRLVTVDGKFSPWLKSAWVVSPFFPPIFPFPNRKLLFPLFVRFPASHFGVPPRFNQSTVEALLSLPIQSPKAAQPLSLFARTFQPSHWVPPPFFFRLEITDASPFFSHGVPLQLPPLLVVIPFPRLTVISPFGRPLSPRPVDPLPGPCSWFSGRPSAPSRIFFFTFRNSFILRCKLGRRPPHSTSNELFFKLFDVFSRARTRFSPFQPPRAPFPSRRFFQTGCPPPLTPNTANFAPGFPLFLSF